MFQRVSNRLSILNRFRIVKFELPERLKGGRVENWAKYWKVLINDYKSAVMETVQDAKDRPRKAAFYIALVGTLYVGAQTAPGQEEFECKLNDWCNEVALVGPPIRSPRVSAYLERIRRAQNQGTLRFTNWVFFTLVWESDHSKECSLYSTQCSYLRDRSVRRFFKEQLFDVGMFGRYYLIDRNVKDYDVNEAEWPEEISRSRWTWNLDWFSAQTPLGVSKDLVQVEADKSKFCLYKTYPIVLILCGSWIFWTAV